MDLIERIAQLVPSSSTHRHRYYGVLAPNSPLRGAVTALALIARIYEVFPLTCPMCGGQMRIIAFITFSADIQKILEHIGMQPEAPRITPARGPPLWDDFGAQGSQELGEGVDGVEAEPDWDLANQSLPDYPDEQRTDW